MGSAWAQVLAPDVLARNTTNEVIEIVKQDREIKAGNTKRIYELVEAKVLPHFDFRQMTQLAVARNWARATPEQQQRLTDEFRALLVRTYAASISSVADYKIDFKPLRMRPGDEDVTVSTEVSKPGSPPITIDYRMQKQAGGWKVYDVLVDNVSLVTVYRNSFNSEVRKGGIDGLIAALARRNQTASN
jgi:phospholipid transport system substrate-binding protein